MFFSGFTLFHFLDQVFQHSQLLHSLNDFIIQLEQNWHHFHTEIICHDAWHLFCVKCAHLSGLIIAMEVGKKNKYRIQYFNYSVKQIISHLMREHTFTFHSTKSLRFCLCLSKSHFLILMYCDTP